MRVSEAMARADGLRLNTLEEQQKAEWLRQLDGQLWEMVGEEQRGGVRGCLDWSEGERRAALRPGGQPESEGRQLRDYPGPQLDSPGWPFAPIWPEDDPVLLLSGPYEEVYPLYLICKIDYYNQEMDLYANDMVQYNAALAEAKAWWRRNHRPRPSGNWKVM